MNQRIEKIRAYLKEKDIEAFLIIKPENIRYLSGFTGTSAQLLITKNRNYLITDFRYIGQAKLQSLDYDVVKQKGKFIDEIKELCQHENIKQIAFEEEQMVFKMYETYYQALKPINFVPSSQFLKTIRSIKDEQEIMRLKKSAALADEAFSHIISYIKPGVSEKKIALELEFFLRNKGADAISFDFIVASGERGSLPHGVASEKIISTGELVTMDFGCIYKGYCSDITRTVCVGTLEAKQREVYNIVLEAQLAGVNCLRANMKCEDPDQVSREIIEKAGYGEYFGHNLGHSVGLEIHEEPRLAKGNEDLLQPGMVVTVEPGIYIPGFGGVRIEDMILIHENHIEILTKSCKDILVL
ncbi:MAG: Xaa-Pro dipeptidase [Desulfitibacter sp. BRH_c19]|nr:MAG: Xaa-Pro dipeptidase [Desulfitibacter sp. BRH_c19]